MAIPPAKRGVRNRLRAQARLREGCRRRRCVGIAKEPNVVRWWCPVCKHLWDDPLTFPGGRPWSLTMTKDSAYRWSDGAYAACPRCIKQRYREIDEKLGL